MLKNLFAIFIGSGIGGTLRYACSLLIKNNYATTIVVNTIGSCILGCIIALAAKDNTSITPTTKLLLTTGLCGGFTTFSTFSAEATALLQEQPLYIGIGYILLQVILGIVCCCIGLYIGS